MKTMKDKIIWTEYINKLGKVYGSVVPTDDLKEALKRIISKLDDKKMCCVYIDGDDEEPCPHASNYVKKIIKEEVGEEFLK